VPESRQIALTAVNPSLVTETLSWLLLYRLPYAKYYYILFQLS